MSTHLRHILDYFLNSDNVVDTLIYYIESLAIIVIAGFDCYNYNKGSARGETCLEVTEEICVIFS